MAYDHAVCVDVSYSACDLQIVMAAFKDMIKLYKS